MDYSRDIQKRLSHVKKILKDPQVLYAIAQAWEDPNYQVGTVRTGKWFTFVSLGVATIRLVERYESELEAKRIVGMHFKYLSGYTDCLDNYDCVSILTCKQVSPMMDAYIHDKLWTLERDQVNDHLSVCKD